MGIFHGYFLRILLKLLVILVIPFYKYIRTLESAIVKGYLSPGAFEVTNSSA